MMLKLKITSRFKKDYAIAIKRGCKREELEEVVEMLRVGKTLPAKYQDHSLVGEYRGHRECHIQSDWLLIYQVDKQLLILKLIRTGSHSDLF